MDFPDYNFKSLNEQDIREEIISPLLRLLGYRSGTPNNIIREQALSYSKAYLGRKKHTDPDLRGRADYICEAENKVRWVIEAKAPTASIIEDDIQQAWTYANHPEVRAVYFVLSNGIEFQIFNTNKGPDEPPFFKCEYPELEKQLTIIKNILSTLAIIRDFEEPLIDVKPPLGDGLRSIVRVTNGHIIFQKNSLSIAHLNELTLSVKSGYAQRNEDGKIIAYINTVSPYAHMQKLNEKFGLHKIEVISESEVFSTDKENPTILENTHDYTLPKGEVMIDIATMSEVALPHNINLRTYTKVSAYLEGNMFKGDFTGIIQLEGAMPVNLVGDFLIYLG